jgi:hypothetical protein
MSVIMQVWELVHQAMPVVQPLVQPLMDLISVHGAAVQAMGGAGSVQVQAFEQVRNAALKMTGRALTKAGKVAGKAAAKTLKKAAHGTAKTAARAAELAASRKQRKRNRKLASQCTLAIERALLEEERERQPLQVEPLPAQEPQTV